MNHIITVESKKYWFSNLPSGWKTGRIKDVYNQVSNTGSDLGEGEYIPLENLESFTGKLIQRVNNENNETTNLFHKGDILLNKLRPYLAKVHLAEFNGGVSGEVIVLRNSSIWKRSTSNKYFFYRFLSSAFINKINSMSEGVKMPRTNPSKILALEIAIPTLKEQTAIAEYLDTKIQAIDKKVSLLEKKIGCYQELRKSLINETVTKGLDKNIRLKNSGIGWIGQIPEHWEVRRVDNLFKERSEKVSDVDFQPLSVSMNGIVLQMDGTAKTQNNENRKRVRLGDIVLNSRSDRRGASGLSNYDGSVSVISIVIAPMSSVDGDYFHHFFKSHVFTEEFYKNGKGIVDDLWSTKYTIMKKFMIPVPPLNEQKEIAKFLHAKLDTITKIIANIQTQITTLKELRKTLINDVVTGKIKVIQG